MVVVLRFEKLNEKSLQFFKKRFHGWNNWLNLSTFGEAPSQWLQVLGVIGVSLFTIQYPYQLALISKCEEKEEKTKT